ARCSNSARSDQPCPPRFAGVDGRARRGDECGMRTITFALAVALAAPLCAQSNAIPGLDIQAFNVSDVGYYGRRGSAFPNGEVAFGIGHSYCNAGTANMTWVATGAGGVMVGTYPQ